jgi:hypothetical protein
VRTGAARNSRRSIRVWEEERDHQGTTSAGERNEEVKTVRQNEIGGSG